MQHALGENLVSLNAIQASNLQMKVNESDTWLAKINFQLKTISYM